MKKEIKFGEKIKINHKLRRKEEYESYGKNTKTWKETPMDEIEVMVIGRRTLSNGFSELLGDDGIFYTPKEYFKALLVVKDMNTNPFYIKYNGNTN